MSEKELRNYLDEMWGLIDESGECRHCPGCGYHRDDCEIGQALATEPDLVRVLRWANERRAYYLDQVSLTHDCQRDVNFYKGKAGMAAELQGYCQQFIRLTDEEPGWEWKESNGTD